MQYILMQKDLYVILATSIVTSINELHPVAGTIYNKEPSSSSRHQGDRQAFPPKLSLSFMGPLFACLQLFPASFCSGI